MNFNVGNLLFTISKGLVDITQKLYDALTYNISIDWLNKILKFFGANINLPASINLLWIFTGASAIIIVTIIIYNIFKL